MLDRHAQPLRRVGGRVVVGVGQQREELLAPEPAEDVLGAERAPQRLPRHHQRLIADGVAVGDQALITAGEALRRALRAEDVLGRIGGEEFLALLPDTDEEAAAHAAERLREAVEFARGPVPITASVGYAVLREGEAPDDLVRRADTALYEAKAGGRNTVRGPATLPRRT